MSAIARPAFIGGTGRSGTTLLVRLLAAHPDLVALTWETQFIVSPGGLIPAARTGFAPDVTDAFIEKLRGRWFRRTVRPNSPDAYEAGLCADVEEDEFEAAVEYLLGHVARVEDVEGAYRLAGEFVQRMFQPLVERSGARTWVEKTPRNVLYQDELQRMFPGSLMIHIIRDGRDVATSMRERNMWPVGATKEFPSTHTFRGEVTLAEAGRYWREILQLARVEAARVSADSYHELYLEDLVSRPLDETSCLADFIGVASEGFPLEMLDASRVGTFDEKLTEAERAMLDVEIGDALAAEGYGPAPGRTPAAGTGSLTARQGAQRERQLHALLARVDQAVEAAELQATSAAREQALRDDVAALEEEVAALRGELRALAAARPPAHDDAADTGLQGRVATLEEERARLSEDLRRITSSRAWRVVRWYRRTLGSRLR